MKTTESVPIRYYSPDQDTFLGFSLRHVKEVYKFM